MSPEIFKSKPYNYKSAMSAIGCVLSDLLTCRHAFEADRSLRTESPVLIVRSLSSLAQKIIRGPYQPLPNTYARGLRDLLKGMLAISPAARPSIAEIMQKVPP